MRKNGGHKLLLDTNILLDACDAKRPQSEEACKVLFRCNSGEDWGAVSPTSLNDAYYSLRKYFGVTNARNCISYLMDMLSIMPFGSEECNLTIRGNEPDFEDGLIRACAELNGVDFIITRDKKAFKNSPVRAVDCAEYLEIARAYDENMRKQLK